MAIESRVILCVGSPGNGRDDILDKMREFTNFHYYHLFEYIVEEAYLDNANLTKLNILDFYDSSPERMEQYYRAAIEKIIEEIGMRSGTHIISTPLNFEWKGNRFQGLYEEDVMRLDPDMFVIIYDDVFRVRNRLVQDIQWKNNKFTLGEIANWRREEIRFAYHFAGCFKPKSEVQLVAYENGPDFLQDVIWSYGRKKNIP